MRNFWWPGVSKEEKQYVEGCDACQRNKNHMQAPAGKLMPNSIPEKPWSHISADFITKLPLAHIMNCLLSLSQYLFSFFFFFSFNYVI